MAANTEIESTSSGMAAYIVDRAKELWDEKKAPLLLSNISPELKLSLIHISFRPVNGEYTEIDNSIRSSPLDAPPAQRAKDA